jgi:hypothetical protein
MSNSSKKLCFSDACDISWNFNLSKKDWLSSSWLGSQAAGVKLSSGCWNYLVIHDLYVWDLHEAFPERRSISLHHSLLCNPLKCSSEGVLDSSKILRSTYFVLDYLWAKAANFHSVVRHSRELIN